MLQTLSGPCIYIYLKNGNQRFEGDLQSVEALKSFLFQHCRFVFPDSSVPFSPCAKVWKEPNPLTITLAGDLMDEEFKNAGHFSKMAKSCSGVLFIDEVPDLKPAADPEGCGIVRALVNIAEERCQQLSIIVAGNSKEVDEKFLSFNKSLRDRFPLANQLQFRDFNDDELGSIFVSYVTNVLRWRIDETPLKIPNGDGTFCDSKSIEFAVGRKLGRMRGPDPCKGEETTKGFGNARRVENFARDCETRAKKRIGLHASNVMTRADILGKKLDVDKSAALAELYSLIGLDEIKQKVDQLVKTANSNLDQEAAGLPVQDVKLHKAFLGNPGIPRSFCGNFHGWCLFEIF